MNRFYSGIQLSFTESQIMPLLCQGLSYREISEALDIRPDRLHSHLHRIRVKTGIRNTHSMEECRAFMDFYKPLNPLGAPTPQQVACLRLHADRAEYSEIATKLGITVQSAMNHVCQGAKRLGVSGKGIHRLIQISHLLDVWEGGSMPDDPMSEDIFN